MTLLALLSGQLKFLGLLLAGPLVLQGIAALSDEGWERCSPLQLIVSGAVLVLFVYCLFFVW